MKFEVSYLQKVIAQNRAEHRAIFEEALEGYKKKLLEELDAYINRIKSGDIIRVAISYPRPDDHTKDYDRVLSMLGTTSDKDVELSELQYSQYVLDEWGWTDVFLRTNSSYSKLAEDKLNG